MNIVKWVIILIVAIVVAVTLYGMGLVKLWERSPEVQLAESEIECVAAGALADSKREPGASLDEVRRNIAKAIVRYSVENRTPVCDVFEKGLTMIPVGYNRTGMYLGRRRAFVKVEFTGAAWTSAVVMSKQIMLTPHQLLGGCATHYIRATRTFRESNAAIAGIRAMTMVPKDTSDPSKIEFFCPKK